MKAVDILFTDDIGFDSDFIIGYSDDQHVEHIIKANPGQYYQYPEIGYGVYKHLNGTINVQTEKKLIKQALENDNFTIPMDGIIIDPNAGTFKIEKYVRKA